MAKNIIIFALCVLLLSSLGGLLFVGRGFFAAKINLAKFSRDHNRGNRIIDGLESDIERLRGDYQKLANINYQLTEYKKTRERNDREALEILDGAISR